MSRCEKHNRDFEEFCPACHLEAQPPLAAPSGLAYLGDTFGGGVVSMARSSKAAIEIVRSFRWNLDDFEHWLDAVITNDVQYLKTITEQMLLPTLKDGNTVAVHATKQDLEDLIAACEHNQFRHELRARCNGLTARMRQLLHEAFTPNSEVSQDAGRKDNDAK